MRVSREPFSLTLLRGISCHAPQFYKIDDDADWGQLMDAKFVNELASFAA
jgi:hypothetical protein